jgi:ABC-type multidrug transport system fused ATPase/permease subunit
MKHVTGVILIIIGGIFMILSSAVGSLGIFQFIYQLAATQWPTYEPIFNIIINVILKWIADLGGVAVIAGAIFILMGALKFGKFIVYIGLAFGTFALVIWVISQIVNLTGVSFGTQIDTLIDNLYSNYSYGTGYEFVGVVFAIIGKNIAVKRKAKEKAKPKEAEEEIQEPERTISPNKKYCPECGTELPAFANFCSKCGKTFN